MSEDTAKYGNPSDKPNRLSNDDLIKIGFKEMPHFTIGHNVVFDLGRNRQLSACGVGSFNEFLYLSQIDDEDPKKITDAICIHNYDFDGVLKIEKVQQLISLLSDTKKRPSYPTEGVKIITKGKEYYLTQIPDDAYRIQLNYGYFSYVCKDDMERQLYLPIPTNSVFISTTKSITEEQSKDFVDFIDRAHGGSYTANIEGDYFHGTAKQALLSLITANGLDTNNNYAIIYTNERKVV